MTNLRRLALTLLLGLATLSAIPSARADDEDEKPAKAAPHIVLTPDADTPKLTKAQAEQAIQEVVGAFSINLADPDAQDAIEKSFTPAGWKSFLKMMSHNTADIQAGTLQIEAKIRGNVRSIRGLSFQTEDGPSPAWNFRFPIRLTRETSNGSTSDDILVDVVAIQQATDDDFQNVLIQRVAFAPDKNHPDLLDRTLEFITPW